MSAVPDALSPLRLFACIHYFKISCITNHIFITWGCCLTSGVRPLTWLQPECCHQVTERDGGCDSVYFLMCALVSVQWVWPCYHYGYSRNTSSCSSVRSNSSCSSVAVAVAAAGVASLDQRLHHLIRGCRVLILCCKGWSLLYVLHTPLAVGQKFCHFCCLIAKRLLTIFHSLTIWPHAHFALDLIPYGRLCHPFHTV